MHTRVSVIDQVGFFNLGINHIICLQSNNKTVIEKNWKILMPFNSA